MGLVPMNSPDEWLTLEMQVVAGGSVEMEVIAVPIVDVASWVVVYQPCARLEVVLLVHSAMVVAQAWLLLLSVVQASLLALLSVVHNAKNEMSVLNKRLKWNTDS